jgi:undecaprenyl-diphosphatase
LELLEAIVLGIVQGLTEFLPVSSSGHLELGKAIFGDHNTPEKSILFTIILHFATALSTIVVYRKDIFNILAGLLKFSNNPQFWFSVKIIISMIPAAVIGLFFESELDTFFGENVAFVGAMLLVTAVLLFMADRSKKSHKIVSARNAFVIGLAQAVAMLPGISRSGATIATSVLLGIDKRKAARFSFLMVIPLIFGKIAQEIFNGELNLHTENLGVMSAGFFAAFISGLLACTWMIRLVRNSKLSYFAVYCIIAGTSALAIGLGLI